MKLKASLISLSCLFVIYSLNSYAELYKWVDDSGKTHYSDKAPKKVIKKEVVSIQQDTANSTSNNASNKVIIRPYEKTSRKLHLLDTVYRWKKETEIEKVTKLGIYNTGKGCTSRGAIKTPDVFIYHKDFLPDESSLAHRISKIINGLDYESTVTKKYDLIKNLKKSGGLSLHSEITDMNIVACAPNLYKNQIAMSVSKISASNFTKNRVSMSVRWQLRTSRDQKVLYETTTSGSFNGWHKSSSSRSAIESAMESAALQLFSDKEFIGKILVEEEDINLNLEKPESQPIVAITGKKYMNLYLDLNDKSWKTRHDSSKEIGNLLFGEKCAASKPFKLTDAINVQKQLFSNHQQSQNAIITHIKPLGYSISPMPEDMLLSLNSNQGYSLQAKLIDVNFESCAPALSASTKYKTFENISTRTLTRNRVRVTIKWMLKTNSNKTTLYQSRTTGIAGNLLTDTDGNKAMQDAIGMATEQLFSERRFIEHLQVKMEKVQPLKQTEESFEKIPSNPIVRPTEGAQKHLFLVADDKPWSSIPVGSSIGNYAYGDGCVVYGQKIWPDPLNKYSSMFPDKGSIANAEAKVIKSLDYKHQISDQYNVINMKRKLGGYSLHSKITQLRYDSCAPGVGASEITGDKLIPYRNFKRHRARVQVDWKLIAKDNKQILFQSSTTGVADSWLINTTGKTIMTLAIEEATRQLFSNRDFVNQIVQGDGGEDKGILDKIFSLIKSDTTASNSEKKSTLPAANEVEWGLSNQNYVQKAYSAQVFVEVSAIKVQMTDFILTQGRWPDSLEEMRMSSSSFQNSKVIDSVNIQSDGSIIAELKEIFGKDRMIKFTPEIDSSGANNRWTCSSNIKPEALPTTCEAL